MIPPASTPEPVTAPVRNREKNAYMARVLAQMLEDLQYPQAKDGSIVDTKGFGHLVAWHLVRCGWRKPNNLDDFPLVEDFDDPVIKKRKVLGPGVFEDAVVWVGFNEPDDPLAGLEDMTLREIESLPEEVRFEAKRRMGLIGTPTPDATPNFGVQPWTAPPRISITDAELGDDTDDSREG